MQIVKQNFPLQSNENDVETTCFEILSIFFQRSKCNQKCESFKREVIDFFFYKCLFPVLIKTLVQQQFKRRFKQRLEQQFKQRFKQRFQQLFEQLRLGLSGEKIDI